MKDKTGTHSATGARLSLHAKPAASSNKTSPQHPDLPMVPSCLKLKRILVPVDFSESSQKAVHYARRFAEQFGSEVTLLHVIQPMVYPADFGYPPTIVDTLDDAVRHQIEERLASLAQQSGTNANTLIRSGQPFYEITNTARELSADLIIITTHGRTGLKHALLGSTAERVVRHAPCPVLTVRDPEHDFA